MKPYIEVIQKINMLANVALSGTGRFKPSEFASNVNGLLSITGTDRIYIEDIKSAFEKVTAGKEHQPKWESVLLAIKTDGGMPASARRARVINDDFIIRR